MKRNCKNITCHNDAAPNRKICYKCRSANIKSKLGPAVMAWYWIRKSAKKRRIEFSLPKDWFIKFVTDSGYTAKSGRLRDDLTIDRRNGDLGYTIDNVRVVTKSYNSAKFHDKINEYDINIDDGSPLPY